MVHEGDVERQTERLLDNIKALLDDGGAGMDDIAYFIVYLRDLSDYQLVSSLMRRLHPSTPHIIVHAKVCRPCTGSWKMERSREKGNGAEQRRKPRPISV